MRKTLLLLICLVSAYPALAGKRVNVQRFKEVVASVEKKPDADAADRLSQFELTERISPARRTEWDAAMPGPKARAALLILVDASLFSPLPAEEGISEPAPDADGQHAMLDASGLYVAQSLSRLPNFFATRETVLFMDAPQASRRPSATAGLRAGSVPRVSPVATFMASLPGDLLLIASWWFPTHSAMRPPLNPLGEWTDNKYR